MSFAESRLGEPSKPNTIRVDAERIAQFARATNDQSSQALAGQVASSLFAIVPVYRPMGAAIRAVTPPERMMYTLHGEQDMRFFEPIRAGMVITATARPVGLAAKEAGTTISIVADVVEESGLALCEMWMSMFIRGKGDDQTAGTPMPAWPVAMSDAWASPSAEHTQDVAPDVTHRFAEASGDPMSIHTDPAAARKFGFKGVICHGLCTMSMAGSAAVGTLAGDDPERVRRLAVRFAKPLYPGQEIRTSFVEADDHDDRRVHVFRTVAQDGEIVLSNGLVEIAR